MLTPGAGRRRNEGAPSFSFVSFGRSKLELRSNIDHRQVVDRPGDPSRVYVVEQKPRLGVASRQRPGLVPARVDAGAIGTGRLGDGHGRAPDQLVQRWRRGGVAGVGEDAAAEVEAVAAAVLVAVDQLD